MRVFGVDFTSAPSRSKPIAIAKAERSEGALQIEEFLPIEGWEAFENWLRTPGPWIAGFDMPLSLPRRYWEALGLADLGWEGAVTAISSHGRARFEQGIEAYRASAPVGQKLLFRQADRLAKASSPMTLNYTPVGKMFFEGAPRLLDAGLNLPAHRRNECDRTAIETFPMLAARRLVGVSKYKSGRGKASEGQAEVRRRIIGALEAEGVRFSPGLAEKAIGDETGDWIDAALCASQAAWAADAPSWGMPPNLDPLEGWIHDPETLASLAVTP